MLGSAVLLLQATSQVRKKIRVDIGQTASNLCQVRDGILKVGGDPGKSPQWKDHGGKQCLFTLKSPPWLCKSVTVV